jgi:hypothetical protein
MKPPHCARYLASAAHQRRWTAKWRGITGVYVEENLRLRHTLEEAKAEMDAAAKTARERASGKAGQAAKKTELQGGQQTDSTGTEAPAIRKIPRYFRLADQPAGTQGKGLTELFSLSDWFSPTDTRVPDRPHVTRRFRPSTATRLGAHQSNRRLPMETSPTLGPDQFRPLRTGAHTAAAAA